MKKSATVLDTSVPPASRYPSPPCALFAVRSLASRTGIPAKIVEGEIDQSKGVALKAAQEAMGYVLLCIAYPRSDCKFEVGVECQDELYINPFKGRR